MCVFVLQSPDIGVELSDGCRGFASKLMHWPEQLIVGDAKKNSSGTIRRYPQKRHCHIVQPDSSSYRSEYILVGAWMTSKINILRIVSALNNILLGILVSFSTCL